MERAGLRAVGEPFTARKLATLIYLMLRWGQPYVDEEHKRMKSAIARPVSGVSRPVPPNSATNSF
jgi:hypothetical protein